MAKAHKKGVLKVNLARSKQDRPRTSSERVYGGCGILTCPPAPYSGPTVMDFKGVLIGKAVHHFQAIRLERSPTGSAHGSFRIDELTVDRRGQVLVVTLGYNCSWPDDRTCARLARQNEYRVLLQVLHP